MGMGLWGWGWGCGDGGMGLGLWGWGLGCGDWDWGWDWDWNWDWDWSFALCGRAILASQATRPAKPVTLTCEQPLTPKGPKPVPAVTQGPNDSHMHEGPKAVSPSHRPHMRTRERERGGTVEDKKEGERGGGVGGKHPEPLMHSKLPPQATPRRETLYG